MGNSGCFLRKSLPQQSCVSQPTVHAGCFSVSIIHRTLTQATEFLTCAQTLMQAIANREGAEGGGAVVRLPHRKIEPASAVCRSDALPTELHLQPPSSCSCFSWYHCHAKGEKKEQRDLWSMARNRGGCLSSPSPVMIGNDPGNLNHWRETLLAAIVPCRLNMWIFQRNGYYLAQFPLEMVLPDVTQPQYHWDLTTGMLAGKWPMACRAVKAFTNERSFAHSSTALLPSLLEESLIHSSIHCGRHDPGGACTIKSTPGDLLAMSLTRTGELAKPTPKLHDRLSDPEADRKTTPTCRRRVLWREIMVVRLLSVEWVV